MNHAATQQLMIKLPAWRRRVLLIAVLAGFAVLLGRGVYLQGMHKGFLQKEGDARYSRAMTLPAHRGMITDRYGEPLAISTPVESIWANPSDVKITADQTARLAKLLNLKPADLSKKLSNSEREFVYIKRRIPPELAHQVMRLGISGVFMQREYRRYYPAGEVTAHLVGFTGIDDNGQEGFELKYQSWLAGKPGSRRVIKDRQGHIVEDLEAAGGPALRELPGGYQRATDIVAAVDHDAGNAVQRGRIAQDLLFLQEGEVAPVVGDQPGEQQAELRVLIAQPRLVARGEGDVGVLPDAPL